MNLDLLKQKRAEAQNLQNRGGGNKFMWSPEEGDQIIRLVPYIHNMDWPFTTVYKHFNIAEVPFVSPITYGKPDPIKEFGDFLKSQAGGDKQLYKTAMLCEPKVQNYIPILVRGKESEGIKFWALGIENYNKILDFMNEPSYGDITNPETGRDIKVTFKKSTKPGAYSTTTILVMPDRSPVTTDPNVLQLFSSMPNVMTLLTEPTADEVNSILEKFKSTARKVNNNTKQSADSQSNASQQPYNNQPVAQPIANNPANIGPFGSMVGMNTQPQQPVMTQPFPAASSTTLPAASSTPTPDVNNSFAQYFKQS